MYYYCFSSIASLSFSFSSPNFAIYSIKLLISFYFFSISWSFSLISLSNYSKYFEVLSISGKSQSFSFCSRSSSSASRSVLSFSKFSISLLSKPLRSSIKSISFFTSEIVFCNSLTVSSFCF